MLRLDEGRTFVGDSIEGFHPDVSLMRRLVGLSCPLDIDKYDHYNAEWDSPRSRFVSTGRWRSDVNIECPAWIDMEVIDTRASP